MLVQHSQKIQLKIFMVGRLEWSLPWAGNPGCFMEGSTTFGSVIFILFYSIIEVGLLW